MYVQSHIGDIRKIINAYVHTTYYVYLRLCRYTYRSTYLSHGVSIGQEMVLGQTLISLDVCTYIDAYIQLNVNMYSIVFVYHKF